MLQNLALFDSKNLNNLENLMMFLTKCKEKLVVSHIFIWFYRKFHQLTSCWKLISFFLQQLVHYSPCPLACATDFVEKIFMKICDIFYWYVQVLKGFRCYFWKSCSRINVSWNTCVYSWLTIYNQCRSDKQ